VAMANMAFVMWVTIFVMILVLAGFYLFVDCIFWLLCNFYINVGIAFRYHYMAVCHHIIINAVSVFSFNRTVKALQFVFHKFVYVVLVIIRDVQRIVASVVMSYTFVGI